MGSDCVVSHRYHFFSKGAKRPLKPPPSTTSCFIIILHCDVNYWLTSRPDQMADGYQVYMYAFVFGICDMLRE